MEMEFVESELVYPDSTKEIHVPNTQNVYTIPKSGNFRRHLKDQVPVSELATEHNLQPGRTHQWIESGPTQLERAFEKPGRKPKRSAGKLEQFKDQKIHRLEEKPALKNEVISGLLEENVKAEKLNGDL